MADLSTKYLGLSLKNPLVASASPQCEVLGNIELMEEAGAGAVVLHSLFEEQLAAESAALDQALSAATESYAESLTFLPEMQRYNLGPEAYLEHIRRAKKAVKIPVIASLNGSSRGGWIKFAKEMEQAGADALELNIYYIPVDARLTSGDIEQLYIDIVKEVKATVKIPVAVKLGPYFTAMANFAKRLDAAGADGLVLFNRFYQPDFNLDELEVVPNLILSNPYELLLRLHWTAVLYGNIRPDIAITGGVHSAIDVIKSMMAGARVAQMTSALLRHGIHHIRRVERELSAWMEEHEYESIHQMQGSMSRKSVPQPAAFERGNYVKVLSSYVAGMPV